MLPRKRSPNIRPWIGVGALLILALLLSACQTAEPEVVIEEVTRIVEVEVTRIVEVEKEPSQDAPAPLPEQSDILAAWTESPHGNTYGLGKGPNTYCSRCHSPQNWDPASTTSMPPNCVTCKFPTDEEIRMAPTMDFVEEADWVGIVCETCHLMEDDLSTGSLAWFNPLTGEHDPVSTPNELCAKCHLTSAGVSATQGRGVTHEIYLGGSAHKNWAGLLDNERRPEYCSECHDPHTQTPRQCEDCHPDVRTWRHT